MGMKHHVEKKNLQTTTICIPQRGKHTVLPTIARQNLFCLVVHVVSKNILNEIKGLFLFVTSNFS